MNLAAYINGSSVPIVLITAVAANLYRVRPDGGNATALQIHVMHGDNSVNVANNTDLSAVTFNFVAFGPALQS